MQNSKGKYKNLEVESCSKRMRQKTQIHFEKSKDLSPTKLGSRHTCSQTGSHLIYSTVPDPALYNNQTLTVELTRHLSDFPYQMMIQKHMFS